MKIYISILTRPHTSIFIGQCQHSVNKIYKITREVSWNRFSWIVENHAFFPIIAVLNRQRVGEVSQSFAFVTIIVGGIY